MIRRDGDRVHKIADEVTVLRKSPVGALHSALVVGEQFTQQAVLMGVKGAGAQAKELGTTGMAATDAAGGLQAMRGITGLIQGGVQVRKAVDVGKHQDTISQNAAMAGKVGGATTFGLSALDTGAGLGSTVANAASLAGSPLTHAAAVPFLGDPLNIGAAVVKGAKALEDTVASARLGLLRGGLDDELHGDSLKPTRKILGETDKARGKRLKVLDRNDWLSDRQRRYRDLRNLRKVAGFGQRRLGETASLNAVEAAGHVLDATGTFTAGADAGITKGVGKGLKTGAGVWKLGQGVRKRAGRVAKLAEIRDAVEHGGTPKQGDRGPAWQAKMFFTPTGPSVEERLESSERAIRSSTLSKSEKQLYLRKAALQCTRRVNDLVACLLSGDDDIRDRAKEIVHVIAETSLAGTISKISDDDLDWFRDMEAKCTKDPPDPNANPRELARRVTVLKNILKARLQGAGG